MWLPRIIAADAFSGTSLAVCTLFFYLLDLARQIVFSYYAAIFEFAIKLFLGIKRRTLKAFDGGYRQWQSCRSWAGVIVHVAVGMPLAAFHIRHKQWDNQGSAYDRNLSCSSKDAVGNAILHTTMQLLLALQASHSGFRAKTLQSKQMVRHRYAINDR
jgi:hypothetical protein